MCRSPLTHVHAQQALSRCVTGPAFRGSVASLPADVWGQVWGRGGRGPALCRVVFDYHLAIGAPTVVTPRGATDSGPRRRCGHEARIASVPRSWPWHRPGWQCRGDGPAHGSNAMNYTSQIPDPPHGYRLTLTPHRQLLVFKPNGRNARSRCRSAVPQCRRSPPLGRIGAVSVHA